MKNQGADGAMVFEPGYIEVEKGDTVQFVATDKLHNRQSLLVPEGAVAWNGKVDEEIMVPLEANYWPSHRGIALGGGLTRE